MDRIGRQGHQEIAEPTASDRRKGRGATPQGVVPRDFLSGGPGTDRLFGGTEADIFFFKSGEGANDIALADIIFDFEDGVDKIQMIDLNIPFDFNDLSFVQQGANTIINWQGTVVANVLNMQVNQFTQDDFV